VKVKIRSCAIKVAETTLTERQLAAWASEFYGAIGRSSDVTDHWVVEFIDFKHPGTGQRVYAALNMSSFLRAVSIFARAA
jgi:hypothetical protein